MSEGKLCNTPSCRTSCCRLLPIFTVLLGNGDCRCLNLTRLSSLLRQHKKNKIIDYRQSFRRQLLNFIEQLLRMPLLRLYDIPPSSNYAVISVRSGKRLASMFQDDKIKIVGVVKSHETDGGKVNIRVVLDLRNDQLLSRSSSPSG